MDISFAELKEKEIVNVFDGKKLGRIIDILFDIESGMVRGIVVPGEKKFFKKSEDIFIPLERMKKIGNDVILVKLQFQTEGEFGAYGHSYAFENQRYKNQKTRHYNYYKEYNNDSKQSNHMVNYNQNVKTQPQTINKSQSQSNSGSYVRFKPINNMKYK